VLSATHTGEMDPQDQGDIIKKVKASGANDGSEEAPAEAPTEDQPEEVPSDDANNTFDSEPSEEEPLKELGLGDYRTKILLNIYDKGSDAVKKILTRLVSFSDNVDRNAFLRDVLEGLDPDEMDFVFDRIKAIGVPIPTEPTLNEDEGMILNNPKKNNMFQKGSNDILDEMKPCWSGYKQVGMKEKNGKQVPNCVPISETFAKNLQIGEKKSIFVDNTPLKESLNQDDMTQPAQPITKPKVKPDTKPIIQPRKNRPFLPNVTPDVRPDPKAVKEENPEASMVDPKIAKAEKKKALNYPIYHETFSSAVQAARAFAEAKGYTIDDDEWFFQVSTGPRKPDEGMTNRYTLELLKDGKLQKMHMHMQIYNMGNKYELNAYVA